MGLTNEYGYTKYIAFLPPALPYSSSFESKGGGAVRKESKDVPDSYAVEYTNTDNLFPKHGCVINKMTYTT